MATPNRLTQLLVTHYSTILATLTSLVSKSPVLSLLVNLDFWIIGPNVYKSLSYYHLFVYAPAIVSRAEADVCRGRGKRGNSPKSTPQHLCF